MRMFAFFAALTAAVQMGEPLTEDPEPAATGRLALWLILLAMAQASFCAAFSDIAAALRRGAFIHPPGIPMSVPERVAGFALNGSGCGYLAGMGMTLAVTPFALVGITHAWNFAAHAVATCLTFSLLGILSAFRTRATTPSAMLHGAVAICLTFAPIMLVSPEQPSVLWHTVLQANPFFHLAEGFRHGVMGGTSISLPAGLLVVCVLNVVLVVLCCRHFPVCKLREAG